MKFIKNRYAFGVSFKNNRCLRRALILFLGCAFTFPIALVGQAKIVLSNGKINFEEYKPIIYPDLSRVVGLNAKDSCELTIMPGCEFSYSFQNNIDNPDSFEYLFRQAIIKAISGWRFENFTDQAITVKLNIFFELSGTTEYIDSKLKNQIIFDQNSITIKVIDTKRLIVEGKSIFH
jgi:hypothetical protein